MNRQQSRLDNLERTARIHKVFGGLTNGDLVVLKGHLLIEEMLYEQVSAKIEYPEFLDKANLRFYQLLNVARSMFLVRTEETKRADANQMWDGIEALNSLRNRLAHNLTYSHIEPLLLKMGYRLPPPPFTLDNPQVVRHLTLVIMSYISFVSNLPDMDRRARKWKVTLDS